jgi:hypothetical protein
MSRRILMTTVAALALAAPAAAQDQTKPLDSAQQPSQQLEAPTWVLGTRARPVAR